MKIGRKLLLGIPAVILSGTMVVSALLPSMQPPQSLSVAENVAEVGEVHDITGTIDTDLSQFFDESLVQPLTKDVSADEEISVILTLDTDTVLDAYDKAATDSSVAEFALSREGSAVAADIEHKSNALLTALDNAGIKYQAGDRFDTLLGGIEVTIRAGAFDRLCNAMKGKAGVMVGEVYAPCETEPVENDVNVYEETGIFDSSDSEYDGEGTVIAVLDTGLDYAHTAFSEKGFTADPEKDQITLESLGGVIGKLEASKTTPGLTPANVFISRKVPYAYDYADKDDDVAPINADHGTHVAGVMVGKDSVITGVAPNAQLAVMKVFSEKSEGAKTSWIISALEDCVYLGVDVINMSLGTSCGFTRETDSDARYAVYDRIKEQGISLIAAASNDYNSTFGSEKNGNLGLTSNPDSATVGAPSTYEAALSVASISGVKTPYFIYNENIIYFTEASDSAAKPKDFVSEILANGVAEGVVPAGADSFEFEYEIIPGVGRAGDFVEYQDEYGNPNGKLKGKIALIRRGSTNFEEKASLARQFGAVGCIIYNNVSGSISMNVGRLGNYPVCSLSKDDGTLLVRGGNGKIKISRSQKAGPFMSDFSSWGPTPDLRIKPEITAHGGEIYSAIPGQSYDRLSGTSMASPNQAGVTALVRQYVKEKFGLEDNSAETRRNVTALVNQIMMSTTDIAYNTNGLPFSVRKQGSGLANLNKATGTPAYLKTYDRDTKQEMDKTKIELGDDPTKSGVYDLRFSLVNIGSGDVKYKVGAIVMTEGVSETLTERGDTTVSEKGYLLEGARIEITSAEGCTADGDTVTVAGGNTATITLTVTLSDENKSYLDRSFANGMYVEGFVTLTDCGNGATKYDLNAPFLAFYGDWGAAPLFDLDYFATNADELDDSKETWEKTLPDAYATVPYGGLYGDDAVPLGSFVYVQDPASTSKVSADRDHIAIGYVQGSEDTVQGSICSIDSVSLGLLRGAKRMVATITDAVTGEVIFTKEQLDISKAYNRGSAIYGLQFDVGFNVADYNLPNNSRYIFTLTGYLDYKDGSVSNNTFEFPFYIDMTAPIVTGVEYTYEYDRETETNRLFANISIYDNHYVQAITAGYIQEDESGYFFNRYLTPVVGGRNTTSVVQIELTDYLDRIKNQSYSKNSFIVEVIDYALNTSMFELTIPDKIGAIEFEEEEIKISPNEIYNLKPKITPSQDKAWAESIVYTSSDESIARVVNGKLIGIKSGDVVLTAASNNNPNLKTTVRVHVYFPEEPDYRTFNRPMAEDFRLTGYYVNRVYYSLYSDERELGVDHAGVSVNFSNSSYYSLRMYPSESVTIEYDLRGYFDDDFYKVEFTSNDPSIVSVDKETGRIEARNVDANGKPLDSERSATVSARLFMLDPDTGEYVSTYTSRTINVTVKKAYSTNGPYLVSYKGLGGEVEIPADYGFTEIQSFAFSNWQLVPKDLSAGDEITKEDPSYSKQWYLGDDTITRIVVPEGVKTIGMYAFANLSQLQSISLPSTLTKIQTGAFLDCAKLSKVEFPKGNNLQFINQRAFEGCTMLTSFDFSSIIAMGDACFKNAGLINVRLPAATQSIGAEAFAGAPRLKSFTVEANKIKIGVNAFNGCTQLLSVSSNFNASVLPAGIFEGCTNLKTFRFGADVSVIGEYVLKGTGVTRLEVDPANPYLAATADNKGLIRKGTTTLAFVAPGVTDFSDQNITEIDQSAFSSTAGLLTVDLPKVTKVGNYAFAECEHLSSVKLGELESVGDYAFFGTAIYAQPKFRNGITIGERAFCLTDLRAANIPEEASLGDYAFAQNVSLETVVIGDGVVLGEGAFYLTPSVTTIGIGDDAVIGAGAFGTVDSLSLINSITPIPTPEGQPETIRGEEMTYYSTPYVSSVTSLTIGDNATIGQYAFEGAGAGTYQFYNISGSSVVTMGGSLTKVTLGENAKIGDYAFTGCHMLKDINLENATSIGSYAFFGLVDIFALGETIGGYIGSLPFPTAIESVDLSGLDTSDPAALGQAAFFYSESLTDVTLPETLTAIPDGAFMNCTALKTIDLRNITSVGMLAFAGTPLTEVTLAEGAVINAQAFSGCEDLAVVGNLDRVTAIGASAFVQTALESATLTAATVIGDYAFANSAVTSVSLGEQLSFLGENPFAGCAIGEFADEAGNTTFDVSANVKVIDGVLYNRRPNGYVLVTYPMNKDDTRFTVADDVIRIGAQAFLGAKLSSVTLSRRVGAIGDMAFYGCNDLTVVAFTSVEAPLLEENYNPDIEGADAEGYPYYLLYNVSYFVYDNNDGIATDFGLKIVDYRSYIVDTSSVLYGANFIAPIGTPEGRQVHAAKKLVMIRPINGTGYENFLYSQYFDLVEDGPTARNDAAQEVLDRIAALPATVTLDDRAEVEAIRALYDVLPADQQACVTNYNKLTSAENRIRNLLAEEQPPAEEEPKDSSPWLWIALVGSVAVVAAAAAVVATLLLRGKKAPEGGEPEEEQKPEEGESSDETSDKTSDGSSDGDGGEEGIDKE